MKKNIKVNKKRANKKIVASRKHKARLTLGLPYSYKCRLIYTDVVSLNPTSTAMANYTFSTNGAYDPNISSAGHQPRYWDQLTAIYKKYAVLGSKINVRYANPAADTSDAIVGVRVVTDYNEAYTTPDDFLETSKRNYKILATGSNEGVKCSASWGTKKWFKMNPMQDDTLQGTTTSNPGRQGYFQLFAGALDYNTTDPGYINCLVEIEYIVVFFDRKQPASS